MRYNIKANITGGLLFMSRGLDTKVSAPATKQEKQVTAHVMREKISLKRSYGNKESFSQLDKRTSMLKYLTDEQG